MLFLGASSMVYGFFGNPQMLRRILTPITPIPLGQCWHSQGFRVQRLGLSVEVFRI